MPCNKLASKSNKDQKDNVQYNKETLENLLLENEVSKIN